MKANLENLNRALLRYLSLANDDAKQVKELHAIRVTARQLIVVMNPDDSLTLSLKKMIQSSNKIRDLDVFIHEILPLFPKKYQLDLTQIQQALEVVRVEMNHEFKNALILNTLPDIEQAPPLDLECVKQNDAGLQRHQMTLKHIERRLKKAVKEVKLLDLEDKQLHKIRLVIKRLHYQLVRFYPKEKKSIHLTKQMQDQLGKFHDFYQAIKILKLNKSLINPKAYKTCMLFLKEQKRLIMLDIWRL